MLSREKSTLTLIYARRRTERQVLLGAKKRGFGAGKLNGFGGKLEPGETVEESAMRELEEECGLRCQLADLRWCGSMTYLYDTKPKAMEVHIYELDRWEGEPQETQEMRPSWFLHEDIPLQDMWADDEHWLLPYLDGRLAIPFRGRFRFQGHEGADSSVILESSVCSMASPSAGPSGVASPGGAALIASTVSFRNAPEGSARPLESFVRYHLLKGFARILLFVDDAGDGAALAAARKFPAARVLVRVRGESLLGEQRLKCPSYHELAPLAEGEVSARQMLDAELAMALAPELGCSWVVCLDSDELFFTRESSVVPHFEALAADGVDQMTYLNHEGVPESLETPDYFATTTLFRRHHFAVPLSPEARQGLRFWMDRSRRGQYLLFYDNGKSACRSGLGAQALSQHLWRLPEGRRSRTALADMRRMEVEAYRECSDPCILHFPVCGLAWLRAKYRTLGAFPDAWLGKVRLPESFHSDAREACASGDAALEEAFRREVLLEDAAEAARQVACGTCLRIRGHALLLDAVPARPDAAEEVVAPPRPAAAVGSSALPSGPEGIERGWILSKSLGYL
mmetsp:Transcript_55001/g.170368  ORF Transcript_55001/g.170368 Transcript_55001/m.170368 type:complete len:570 (-) Transcript_55001:40-1749(-)